MKLLRVQRLWWLATIVTSISARTLLEVLGSYPELSTLNGRVANSSSATSLLVNANNFTLLAPSNDAIETFLSNTPNTTADALLEASLQYSLLKGGFPRLSFTNNSLFIASNLVNATYANVTDGQVVQLVTDPNGAPQAVSGNKSVSRLTTTDLLCTGGIVHIIDEVLSVPVQAVDEVTAAGLDYFIQILNDGGFLSAENAVYVDVVLAIPDVTFFIPNSAAALANFKNLSQNSSAEDLRAAFQYHIIPSFVGYSSLLKNGSHLTSMEGTNVTITIQDGEIYVNEAKVIATNYLISNGVIHVIENLLDRFDTSPPPPPSSTSTSSAVPSSTPAPSRATSTPTSAASSSSTATSADPVASSGSDNKGLKIGLGVGLGVAGLLLLAALAFFLLRRRKQKRDASMWGEQNMPDTSPTMAYVRRGQVHRQADSGFGSESTGAHAENIDSNTPMGYPYPTVTIPSTPQKGVPPVPMRSPSRATHGEQF